MSSPERLQKAATAPAPMVSLVKQQHVRAMGRQTLLCSSCCWADETLSAAPGCSHACKHTRTFETQLATMKTSSEFRVPIRLSCVANHVTGNTDQRTTADGSALVLLAVRLYI